MFRRLVLLSIAVSFASNVDAAEREGIAKCSSIQSSADRLVCFDLLSRSLGVDKPITSVTEGKGKWIVRSEKSPINDATNVVLYLKSEKEVRSGYNTVSPSLIIRCSEKKTNAYIIWDLYLGMDSTTMLTRLDKESAVTKSWSISTDYKAVFVSGSDVAFAKELMLHKTLLVQITPYGESPVMTTFEIGGLTDAIKPLREACNW